MIQRLVGCGPPPAASMYKSSQAQVRAARCSAATMQYFDLRFQSLRTVYTSSSCSLKRQLTMSLTCCTHCADAVPHSGQRLYHPTSLRSLSHSVGSLSHGHPYYRTALSTANYSAPLTPRTGPDLVPSYITLTFGCKRTSADCRRARIPPPQPRWIVVSPTSTAA